MAVVRNAAAPPGPGAEEQLKAFIDKFSPEDQRLIRAVRRALRKRLPSAHELVYDNYNFFVIGYSPTERPSDAILSIAAQANRLSLCLLHGAKVPDPMKRLTGAGKQVRSLRIESSGTLAEPDVEALITAALAQSKTPLPASGRGTLIIRSISAKQRPRRKIAR